MIKFLLCGLSLTALTALTMIGGGAAQAQTVSSFQIESDTNGTPIDYTGGGVLGGSFTHVLASGGSYSSTQNGITFAATGDDNDNEGATANGGASPGALLNQDLYTYTDPTNPNNPDLGGFSFTGLQANGVYNIVLYSNSDTFFDVNDPVNGPAFTEITGSQTATFATPDNYFEFLGVNADSTGTITGDYTAGNEYSALSGAQIAAAVPETSSLVSFGFLLALGTGCLLAVARRPKAVSVKKGY